MNCFDKIESDSDHNMEFIACPKLCVFMILFLCCYVVSHSHVAYTLYMHVAQYCF